MMRRISQWAIALCLALSALAGSLASSAAQAQQQSLDACPIEQRIEQAFDNGAAWSFCWYARERDGLVIESARYTTAQGRSFGVLASASLAQLHVAYDDSAVTYSDVTQYGLGGNWLQTLDESDCAGQLIGPDGRSVLCLQLERGGPGSGESDALSLFSVSQVGAYVYIITWRFGDDGTFAPTIGASGALQRRSSEVLLPFGRVLAGEPDSLWLSHTHNYYWRLDLDLGDDPSDDIVTRSDYATLADGRRARTTTTLDAELAVRFDRDVTQAWHIRDHAPDTGQSPHSVAGFRLETAGAGHAFERPQVEDWAGDDLFITVARDCERFASQNTRFSPGCKDDVGAYVDGEALAGADLVLWQRIAFHHVPRNEDRRHMHTHWDGFQLTPDNLHPVQERHANGPAVESPRDDAAAPRASSSGRGASGASWLVYGLLLLGWRRRSTRRPSRSM